MSSEHPRHILISTKLAHPPLDRKWVRRPRLIGRLNEGVGKRLTLICAPAGFGKTTLAVQWLAQTGEPYAWITLDKSDSDADRFLHYLVAALRAARPAFGRHIEALLASPEMPPSDYLADAVIAELSAVDAPLRLVLDDFHVIDTKTVPAMLRRIIRHLPGNIRLVISTRMDPALPLAKWRIRNWLAEFRATDLFFTEEEARAFFVQFSEKELSAESMATILNRTEGWAAGLQLVRISMAEAVKHKRTIRNFFDGDGLIVDFLIDELVSHQPAEVRRFLAVTALFNRFCAPLCETILAGRMHAADIQRIMERLEVENLFLVPLDRERHWFRYHHLFRNLLVNHLKPDLSGPSKIRIHRKAGKWFVGQGLIGEALHHLLAAGDVDAAADIVEERLDEIIDEDLSRRTLKRWLEMFPKGAELNRPALLVAHAYIKITHWDLPGLGRLLDSAEALLKGPARILPEKRRRKLMGDIDVQRGFYLYWQGDAEGSLHHTRRALRIVKREHLNAHGTATLYAASAYAVSGRRNKALNLLADALAADCSEGSRNAGPFLTAATTIHYYAGNFNEVDKCADRMLAIHETVPVPDYWYGYAHYFLASVAYERNRLAVSAEHFSRVEQLRYRVNTRLYHDALLGLAFVALAEGETDGARECAKRARAFAVEMNDPYSLIISAWFETRLALRCGEAAVEPPADSPTVDSNRFWLEVPSLGRAEYLVGKTTPSACQAALTVIQDGLLQAERHHNLRQALQFQAVRSVALKCAGRLNDALETLEETLQAAEPLGLVRTFVDRGPLMFELLNALRDHRTPSVYRRHILDAFAQESRTADPDDIGSSAGLNTAEIPDTADSELLSNREIQVLALLAQRLSNKEIAERLFVSPETVKKHTANLYRKLDVRGRRQAVQAGRRLGLVEVHSNPA